jgi:hypothetical protein
MGLDLGNLRQLIFYEGNESKGTMWPLYKATTLS